MRDYFLFAGMALCLFSLWVTLRRDWVRMTTICRTVRGVVIGHHLHHNGDGKSWAPIYRFSAEGAEHEVTDQVFSSRPQPDEGTTVELSYPHGRPDLARPPRPLMWASVYLLMIGLLGVLFSVWMGWLKN